MSWLSNLLKREKPSPRDIVAHSDISYNESTHTVRIRGIKPDVWLTTVADTNSMDPTVDAGHTCILTNNFDHSNLAIGDIIVYAGPRGYILHRITRITEDGGKRHYRVRGDNNFFADPYVLVDENIKWLLVGIIY